MKTFLLLVLLLIPGLRWAHNNNQSGLFGSGGASGTVTAVTASPPLKSSGGTSQAISLNAISNTPSDTPGDTIVDVGFGSTNVFQDETSGNTVSTITAGQTVEWKWVNGLHTVVSLSAHCGANPCAGLEDGRYDSGDPTSTVGHKFAYTFTNPGTYYYYCDVHGFSMQGSVVVSAAGGTPRLDQVLDPTADKDFALANHHLGFLGGTVYFTLDQRSTDQVILFNNTLNSSSVALSADALGGSINFVGDTSGS